MSITKKSLNDLSVSEKRLDELKQLKDKDIDYSDIPETDARFWDDAEVRLPEPKKGVYIRLDDDVLKWFKAKGKGYQTRINSVLRSYYEAHHKDA